MNSSKDAEKYKSGAEDNYWFTNDESKKYDKKKKEKIMSSQMVLTMLAKEQRSISCG